MAERFDITTTKKWKMDGRKRLIVESTPTRSGVFTYFDNTGKMVKELRHPDDVFSRETMDSLKGIIYTTQKNHVSLMNPDTVRERTYGFTLQNAERVDNHSKIDIKINDGSEIKAIMGGKSLELSNGYTCDVIPEAGEFEGEKYDARQKNIVYDHVARVEKARGGESCRIRLDSESAISGIEAERLDSGNNQSTGETMAEKTAVLIQREIPKRESGENFRLDSFSVKIDDSQGGTIDKFMDREDKLVAELNRINSLGIERKANFDAAQSKIKELEKDLENAVPSGEVESRLDAKLNLWDLAEFYGLKDYKSQSDKDLSTNIIKTSKRFDEDDIENAEYRKFCIKNLSKDSSKKSHKSRENLALHQGFKLDNSDDDLHGESELESA